MKGLFGRREGKGRLYLFRFGRVGVTLFRRHFATVAAVLAGRFLPVSVVYGFLQVAAGFFFVRLATVSAVMDAGEVVERHTVFCAAACSNHLRALQ